METDNKENKYEIIERLSRETERLKSEKERLTRERDALNAELEQLKKQVKSSAVRSVRGSRGG